VELREAQADARRRRFWWELSVLTEQQRDAGQILLTKMPGWDFSRDLNLKSSKTLCAQLFARAVPMPSI